MRSTGASDIQDLDPVRLDEADDPRHLQRRVGAQHGGADVEDHRLHAHLGEVGDQGVDASDLHVAWQGVLQAIDLGAMHLAGRLAQQLYPSLHAIFPDGPSAPLLEELLRMDDPFIKKLYSTYLSYLPADAFSYSLDMKADGGVPVTRIELFTLAREPVWLRL